MLFPSQYTVFFSQIHFLINIIVNNIQKKSKNFGFLHTFAV